MRMGKGKTATKEYDGLFTQALPGSRVAEQIRTVRTNINFAMVDKRLQTLVITSAAPDAGKTTIAGNLAASFALQGYRVLLAEGDLRRPSLHKLLGVANEQGVTSLLSDPSLAVEACIKTTETPGLSVLTCGPVPPNPAELIASNQMTKLQAKLVNLFDLVIFDTPPLLGFSDASILAGRADGTIFVVQHGVAKKEDVVKVKEIFEKVDANVLGAIYNKVPASDSNESYYYDYYAE